MWQTGKGPCAMVEVNVNRAVGDARREVEGGGRGPTQCKEARWLEEGEERADSVQQKTLHRRRHGTRHRRCSCGARPFAVRAKSPAKHGLRRWLMVKSG
jgi:hypothetical protein